MGKDNMKSLLTHLNSKDTDKRVKALNTVTECDRVGPDVLLAVARLLSDSSIWDPSPDQPALGPTKFVVVVGHLAVALFPKLGGKSQDAIRILIQKIPELTGTERITAMDAVCAVGPEALYSAIKSIEDSTKNVVPIIQEILEERKRYHRICAVAIRVLGLLGAEAEGAVSSIVYFLSKKYSEEITNTGYDLIGTVANIGTPAEEAGKALVQIVPEEIPQLLSDAMDSVRDHSSLFPVFRAIGPTASPLLIKILRNESRNVRLEAARILTEVARGSLDVEEALNQAVKREKGWFTRRRMKKYYNRIRKRPIKEPDMKDDGRP